MRTLLAVVWLAVFVSAARAQDWQAYDNTRYGFHIDVPPAFGSLAESENGDGATWHSADGKAELRAWGSQIVDGSFRNDNEDRQSSDAGEGWKITSFAGRHLNERGSPEAWRFYTGTRHDRILYQRSVAACKGTQAVHVRVEYPRRQQGIYGPFLKRLITSVTAGAADCPGG